VPFAAFLANWIPDPSPSFGSSPTPFIVLMVIGFVVAVAGHIMRFRLLVAGGILAIFLATFIIPLLVYLGKS
jgi:hypothetical protein